MNTLQRGSIVVGVDEVALAGQAVRWAGEQAALEGRRILLVRAASAVTTGWSTHAMDVPPGTFTSQRLPGDELLGRARDQVHAVAPDVEVDELVEVTDPRTLILRAAEGAHLVVLGSRGRGPLLSHLLGSVGVGVVRRADCPVVVHRPGHPGRVHDGVVVAVDATQDAMPVLEHAFHQASLRDLPLRVVHYVMDPFGSRRCPDGRRPLGADAAGRARALRGDGRHAGEVPRRADEGLHDPGTGQARHRHRGEPG